MRLFRKKKSVEPISDELKKSFTPTSGRKFNEGEFQMWFAKIRMMHHPINQEIFN